MCAEEWGWASSPLKLTDRKPSRRSFPVFPGGHFGTWKSHSFGLTFVKCAILLEIRDRIVELPEKVDLASSFWRFSACQNLCLGGRDLPVLERTRQREN